MDLNSFLYRFLGGFVTIKQLERIYKRTTFCSNGCWECSYTPSNEYPCIYINNRIWRIHRILLYLEHNLSLKDLLENSSEKWALHKCKNRRCIRPDHLHFGNRSINMIDAVKDNTLNTQKIDYLTAVNIRFNIMMGMRNKDISTKYEITRKMVYDIKTNRTWIPNNYRYDYQAKRINK